jgi:glycosyltransferase involved in cell wall biosynthesis
MAALVEANEAAGGARPVPWAATLRACIVVPCYNEETRLDVKAFDAYLASCSDVGFVLVNDGSRDGTLRVLEELAARWPGRVQALDQQPNQGKGQAVRVGCIHALDSGASYVGYFDADLATPLEAIPEFTVVLERNPRIDIVLGARIALLGRQIDRSPVRHYLGRVFATAASLVLDLPVYDTQCGAKLLRATATVRKLFDAPFGSRWIFDVELLARYLLRGPGSRDGLYELALQRWTDVGDSRVKPRDFARAAAEMAAIYRMYRLPGDKRRILRLLSAPFLRYAGAGGIGTAVHSATLATAVEIFHLNPTVGTSLGAMVGAGVNYLLNYHLTFASKASHRRTLPRFFAVALLSIALNTIGMWLAVTHYGVHWLPAWVVCTIVVLLVGYLLNKAWTFAATQVEHAAVDREQAPVQAQVPPAYEAPKP